MPTDLSNPDYFWSRAEEARTMAEQMKDPDNKRLMFGVGETYEVLAKRAEQRRSTPDLMAAYYASLGKNEKEQLGYP
jgi:hypothetical protein